MPPDAATPVDAYSPSIIFTSPGVGVTVDPSSTVRIGFDVDVTGVTASSFTVAASGAVPGNVTYDPAMRQATFTGLEGLPPNQQLTVTLTGDIAEPTSGRPLMPTSYMFRTSQDTTAPRVVSTDPSNNMTGVSVGANVSFRFSEPVVSIDSTTIRVFETATTDPVAGTVIYDSATRTATFDPQDQLTPNLSYNGRAMPGIADNAGHPLFATPVITNFTTGADTVAPSVRTTSPASMDTNVAVTTNIVVTFDEPVTNVNQVTFQVNGGVVTGAVVMSNGNRTATFDPTNDLPAASTINVTLAPAILDSSGNALGAFAYSFSTL